MNEQEIESFIDDLCKAADEHSGMTTLREQLKAVVDPVLLEMHHQQALLGCARVEIDGLKRRAVAASSAPAVDVGARESFRLALSEYGAECNASINASKMDAARDRVFELYDRATFATSAEKAS
ncbi:hypothetical protein [Paraburkholderia terrae]|uniref:hypothetical protein n=1 Tax=Paraburkholderia terrae TaxID=311230 RepID=UPI00205596F5|nr:hypothetical protein [Paraburkholderia terrae]BDC37715.1 hypothetical protein PTKU15_10120 [Paraburkholderia terrae]